MDGGHAQLFIRKLVNVGLESRLSAYKVKGIFLRVLVLWVAELRSASGNHSQRRGLAMKSNKHP